MPQKTAEKNSAKKKLFPENGVGGNFGFGGRARKITPLIYPLIFKNFFGHENSRRGSCGAAIFFVLLEISSRGPFWAQKWRG